MSEKDTSTDLMPIFQLFAEKEGDKDYFITFDSLKRVAEELKENMTDEELREMIQGTDKKDN